MNIKIAFSLMLSVVLSCGTVQNGGTASKTKKDVKSLEKLSKAYVGSGCFWCVEAIYESVRGVEEAISGYAGGDTKNPTYQQVSSGRLRHAEVVEVIYDPKVVDYETLIKVFFGSHDPTTLNQQGPDRGPQYRSLLMYQNEDEKKIIEDYIAQLESEKVFNGAITTEVVAFTKFWKAEDYHQDYERNNPNQPYVRGVSVPRLKAFQAKFPELLKEAH